MMSLYKLIIFSLLLFSIPSLILGECTCDSEAEDRNKSEALKLKVIGIISILAAGAVGVCLPLLGKIFPALSPEKNVFFLIKAFAAGVILATGFIHVLPDAFENLTSPCLNENPWGTFPFTGFIAMVSGIGTLMIDSYATSFLGRSHHDPNKTENDSDHNHVDNNSDHSHVDEEKSDNYVPVHGHSHGYHDIPDSSQQLIRNRVVSQVLELGIIAHSVIIGISLGASESPKTIRPLVAALTFHQFFEGMGLGGCITQAKFKSVTVTIMSIFFSVTTPLGIGIGLGITNVYDENSTTALIVEGCFNAASAGILIYMALVDLLAVDFMSPKLQNNKRLQLGANVSLLFGAGCMSLLAKWA